MCTAATYQTKDLYFGRTLDYLFSYGEEVVITPRSYPFSFRHMPAIDNHFSLIGSFFPHRNGVRNERLPALL